MKAIIRESAKSTPERPLWTWRLWDSGRDVDFGITTSESEAWAQSQLALEARAYLVAHRVTWPRPGAAKARADREVLEWP